MSSCSLEADAITGNAPEGGGGVSSLTHLCLRLLQEPLHCFELRLARLSRHLGVLQLTRGRDQRLLKETHGRFSPAECVGRSDEMRRSKRKQARALGL
eukprot:1574210-Pyramimonas_sp.AAC.1